MSTIGGGGAPPPPGRGGGGGKNPLNDWLNPQNNDNERQHKKFQKRADASLPISYGNVPQGNQQGEDEDALLADMPNGNGSLTLKSELEDVATLLHTNPYMEVVNKLTPSELIGRFTSTAHPRVQAAVKATILGLIGSLPKMAFDTTTITTGGECTGRKLLMFHCSCVGWCTYVPHPPFSHFCSCCCTYSANIALSPSFCMQLNRKVSVVNVPAPNDR